MANTKKKPAKTGAKTAKAAVKPIKSTAKPISSTDCAAEKPLKGFFARKCDPTENILTIFKKPSLYGALLAEGVGTMLLAMVFLTLGMYQPLYLLLVMVGITAVTFGLSGANLNPLITVGMMATRRMSAIRGVLYIIAQIVGAWIGYLISSAFVLAGGDATELATMTAIEGETFWMVAAIELLAAAVFAFIFARALSYRKSLLTFAAIVASGMCMAFLFAYLYSYNFLGLYDNFAVNPAIALVFQILPSTGADFWEILGNVCLALTAYAVVPMLGGVIGFYLSDLMTKLSGGCLGCGKPGCDGKACGCGCGCAKLVKK